MMEKETYYVNLQKREITKIDEEKKHGLTIYAAPDEVSSLRSMFSQIDTAEHSTFFRSHIPIMSYHNDPGNEHYDKTLKEVAILLYDLGDDETKGYIEESGIIENGPMDTDS